MAFGATVSFWATVARAADDPRFGFSPSGGGDFFIRGDANQDGKVDVSDAVFTLGYLFLGTEDPFCMDAMDSNDDGKVDLSDAVTILGFKFLGNPTAILPPYPDAGTDPTGDSLDCDNGAFAHIRREIFATSCATTSCHSSLAAKGGLILEGMTAYSQLYQMPATNEAASAAHFLRVRPGFPDDSFLYKKITGQLALGEGDRMPQIGLPQSDEDVNLIRRWIEAGSPPSTPADIILPKPSNGEQILVPPFDVPPGKEVQRNYFFKLKNEQTLWVNEIEFLYPPGSHHLNLFTGAPKDVPDGSFEDVFKVVPFGDWSLRASSQTGRLTWRLPTGVATPMDPHQQILAQIHFVNIGSQTSPIGGCAAINLQSLNVDPANPPVTLGSLFLQNKNIKIHPQETISYDYGITLDHYGHNVDVKLAAVTGHFHWRGKKFEIRKWDGLNKNPDGSPATGEFDRMGVENSIYVSDNWDEPPFKLYGDDGPEIPVGWGIVYRTTYVNATDNLYCFGPHVETQEHANAFIYFYPGPAAASGFLWFPPDCAGQGCTVPCAP